MVCKERAKNITTQLDDYFIQYPKNRGPIIHYRDPQTRKYDTSKGRISVASLNKLLKNPLRTISTEAEYNIVAYMGMNEGIREKLFEKGGKIKTPLLKDFIMEYWDYEKSPYLKKERELRGHEKGPSYCKKAQRDFQNHCLSILGDIRIDEFTPRMMEDIQLSMREKEYSSKMINEITSSIKIPLTEAFKSGIVKENIGEKIRLVKNSTKRKRDILTTEETKIVMAYLKEGPDRKLYLMAALALYGAMRVGEIAALKAEALDVSYNIVRIEVSYNEKEKRIKSTKNGEARNSFPIPPEVMEEVIEFSKLNEGSFIFPSPRDSSKPWRPTEVSKAFSPTLEKALGITKEEREERGLAFHSLRHEACTRMIENGVDINLVQKGMGHKTRAMTEHYSNHETEEGKKKFIEATKGIIQYT